MYYENTLIWQKAMDIADFTYDLVEYLPRGERYGLRSQIARAACSVPSNFAEGWTRETLRDKAYFIAVMHSRILAELRKRLRQEIKNGK